jgi:uncharacterized membrane protein
LENRVVDNYVIFGVIMGAILLVVGIVLMYTPVSDISIGRVGSECYGLYGLLIVFAGILFLVTTALFSFSEPEDTSKASIKNAG